MTLHREWAAWEGTTRDVELVTQGNVGRRLGQELQREAWYPKPQRPTTPSTSRNKRPFLQWMEVATHLCLYEEPWDSVLELGVPTVPTQDREERTEVRAPSMGQWAWTTTESQPLQQPGQPAQQDKTFIAPLGTLRGQYDMGNSPNGWFHASAAAARQPHANKIQALRLP